MMDLNKTYEYEYAKDIAAYNSWMISNLLNPIYSMHV